MNGPLDTSENLFHRKRWGERSRLVLYRWKLAEIGGNWLKMAKTVSLEYQFLIFFNAFYVICLCGSVVVFCSWNLNVPGSNFFLIFSFSGQVRVQTPLEFTWFFPTWNLVIFTIYEFLALLLTYNKHKNCWEIWLYLDSILNAVI